MPELKERLLPISLAQGRGGRRMKMKAHYALLRVSNPVRALSGNTTGAYVGAHRYDPQQGAVTSVVPVPKWGDVDLQYLALTPWPLWHDDSGERFRFTPSESGGKGAELERECSTLRQENQWLTEQISELRKLLAKLARQQSDDNSQRSRNVCDSRTSAAEMLASVDEEGFELLVLILEKEEMGFGDLPKSSDLSHLFRLLSWLSSCHAVIVRDDSVVRTDFGQQLYLWLINSTQIGE